MSAFSPRTVWEVLRRDNDWMPEYDALPEWANAEEWTRILRYRSGNRLRTNFRTGRIPNKIITAGGQKYYRIAHRDDIIRYLSERQHGPPVLDGVRYSDLVAV